MKEIITSIIKFLIIINALDCHIQQAEERAMRLVVDDEFERKSIYW